MQQSTSFQIRSTHIPTPGLIDTRCVYNKPNSKGGLLAKQSNDNGENAKESDKIFGVLKKNPGTLLVVPFVALFRFDLIANIAVVTKRSLEG